MIWEEVQWRIIVILESNYNAVTVKNLGFYSLFPPLTKVFCYDRNVDVLNTKVEMEISCVHEGLFHPLCCCAVLSLLPSPAPAPWRSAPEIWSAAFSQEVHLVHVFDMLGVIAVVGNNVLMHVTTIIVTTQVAARGLESFLPPTLSLLTRSLSFKAYKCFCSLLYIYPWA